jgi:spoIIIJ-associated protein
MNAHDRRLIHLALQDDKTLRTRSTGTGLYRKVVISPEKKPT